MAQHGTPSSAEPFEPFVSRQSVRLTTAYATSWHCDERQLAEIAQPAGDFLHLGRLAGFYTVSQRQLPRVVMREDLEPASLGFDRWQGSDTIQAARVWYFALSSGQVLPALSLDVDAAPVETVPLLEDLYYGSLKISGEAFAAWTALTISARFDCDPLSSEYLPERHQLVFLGAGTSASPDVEERLQRLIYRADLPYRPEYSAIRYPAELNRRPATTTALGPYVSVVAGHQDYVENTVLLSGVQAVGAAARLREIRERAYACVEVLKSASESDQPIRERRLMLEETADTLGDLEVELSFSVEATADLGMLVPSLRVDSYHTALYESMSIARRAETTGNMLERLHNAIGAELTTVQSVEQRAEDARRVRIVVAVTLVTTVGGTLGLLFGFFGVNASQVDANRSMFDHKYVWIYLLIALVITGAFVVWAAMRWQERRQRARDRKRQRSWLPRQRIGALRSTSIPEQHKGVPSGETGRNAPA